MHISSSYAKILGEKLFYTREIPRSGSKAEDGERERERKLVITMAKLRMAHASRLGQKWFLHKKWVESHQKLVGNRLA